MFVGRHRIGGSVKEYRVGARRNAPHTATSHMEAPIIAPEGASRRAPTAGHDAPPRHQR